MDTDISGQQTQSKSNNSKKIISTASSNEQSNKYIDSNMGMSSTHLFYKPFILEYTLMSEYKQLQSKNLPGIYVIPSAKSPLRWFGVMFVRQGLYQNGIFKFILHIPDNYPDCETPKLVFQPTVFHPLIDIKSGEMDIKRSFPNWRKNKHQLWHVLQYACRAFYKVDPSLPANSDAGSLYENDIESFKNKVAENIEECKQVLYEPQDPDDSHAFLFNRTITKVQEDFLVKIKEQISKSKECDKQNSGLSWVNPDTQKIFSKSTT